MTFFTIVLLVLLAIFVTAGTVLIVVFIRLSHELARLGDTSEALAVKLQRHIKTVRAIVPTLSLVQKAVHLYQAHNKARKKESAHEKAAKKR